ncbi:MAG: ECF-type sigma factor [Acidobacteriota bacterium]|jgi:RNA polymerase sigma factor (TIGR02999 family)
MGRNAGGAGTAEAGPSRFEHLLPRVYGDLRRIACRYLQGEAPDAILQPTALVHEAYLRLAEVERIDWQGKTHVLAVAAREMRRILVEHARAAKTKKRGGRPDRITLTEGMLPVSDPVVELLSLDQALRGLGRRSPRQARVAELKIFAGMLGREIAGVIGVSERTVDGDWQVARAWLARELRPEAGR